MLNMEIHEQVDSRLPFIDTQNTSRKPVLKANIEKGKASSQTRVVLADDNSGIRAGVRFLLQRAPDITVVGEASDGLQALNLVEELSPDVLVLDMEMPVLNGTEVAAQLQDEHSPVRILVLSAHDDRQYIQSMLENGASGYVIKDDVPELLVAAVRAVAKGYRHFVSAEIARKMALRQAQDKSDWPTLTRREIDILSRLAGGSSPAEIARQTGLREDSLSRYLELLCKKLHADSLKELAERAAHYDVITGKA